MVVRIAQDGMRKRESRVASADRPERKPAEFTVPDSSDFSAETRETHDDGVS